MRHIIGKGGVRADPNKINVMLSWPTPTSVKTLRGFSGLTGYYRKFIRNYGTLAKPLTELTKKGHFEWGDKAAKAFEILKLAMSSAPVLRLLDFTKPIRSGNRCMLLRFGGGIDARSTTISILK